MNFITEDFRNISCMLKELNSRPVSRIFQGIEESHARGRSSWYGTSNYDEALELIRSGYKDILPEIKSKMRKNEKVYNDLASVNKQKQRNLPVGFIPNVPNAIMNLPNSMISFEKQQQKQKTLSIVYLVTGCCAEDVNFFIDSGVILCTAINILEKRGISVKLSIGFFAGEQRDEIVCPTVNVKNYQDKLDLQKLCFPIAHPSMLRRIGFRYLETCSEIRNGGWTWGYGTPLNNLDEIRQYFSKDIHLVNPSLIRSYNFSVKELLAYFKK